MFSRNAFFSRNATFSIVSIIVACVACVVPACEEEAADPFAECLSLEEECDGYCAVQCHVDENTWIVEADGCSEFFSRCEQVRSDYLCADLVERESECGDCALSCDDPWTSTSTALGASECSDFLQWCDELSH